MAVPRGTSLPDTHIATRFQRSELDRTSTVTIHIRWYMAGLAGLMERLVAPRLLRRVYRAELALLDRYARDTAPPPRPRARALSLA